MVAGAPLVRLVERPHPHGACQRSRGEDEVQLAGRGVRRLAVRVECRDVLALPRELPRLGIGLASAWGLRADEGESQRLHPVEHGFVARGPVRAAALSMAVEDVVVTGGQDAVAGLAADERGEVRDDPVGRCIRGSVLALCLRSVAGWRRH